MTSVLKEEIIELIKRLPEDTTLNDIIYHLYVRQKISKGIKDIDQGKTVPHEQVKSVKKEPLKIQEKAYSIELYEELEESKRLLDLKDDWDGLGTKGYTQETWIKMHDFLLKLSEEYYKHCRLILPAPYINPGKNGAIDLHWKMKGCEILLGIPESDDSSISFYADNYRKIKNRGTLEINELRSFIEWIRAYWK